MSLTAEQLLPGLPFAAYRQIKAVNFSCLKEIGHSPRRYLHRLENPRTTQPMRLGTAAHVAVLEPHRFLRDYALWERTTEDGSTAPRRGKAWESFQAEHAGREIISAKEYAAAMAIRDAVRANPDAMRYLRKGRAEVSMIWRDRQTGRTLKGRVDWLTEIAGRPVLVGLKTARDCRPVPFGNAAGAMLYHLQWAMYCDGYETIMGTTPAIKEIAVEPKDEHDSTVYDVPEEVLEVGRDEYHRLLAILAECETSNIWPGAAPGEQAVTLQSRFFQAEDDISALELEM